MLLIFFHKLLGENKRLKYFT